jgi:hypothetical protein
MHMVCPDQQQQTQGVKQMKRISISDRSRDKLLHIEAPGCIINVQIGLADRDGRKVTHVSIVADGNRFSGELPWWIEGRNGISAQNMRIVQTDAPRAKSAAVTRALARDRPLSLRDEVAGVTTPSNAADFGAAYREEGEG